MAITAPRCLGSLSSAFYRAAVLGATLLLVAGCVSSTASPSPQPTSTPQSSTSQPSTSRGFQVATPDGQVSVSLDGKLPPNWPGAFPVPPGAEVAGSGSLGGSASTGQVAVYSTSTSPQDTFTYYKSNSSLTVADAKSVGAGASFVGSMKITSPYTGSVTVLARNAGTYFVVVLKLARVSPSS